MIVIQCPKDHSLVLFVADFDFFPFTSTNKKIHNSLSDEIAILYIVTRRVAYYNCFTQTLSINNLLEMKVC